MKHQSSIRKASVKPLPSIIQALVKHELSHSRESVKPSSTISQGPQFACKFGHDAAQRTCRWARTARSRSSNSSSSSSRSSSSSSSSNRRTAATPAAGRPHQQQRQGSSSSSNDAAAAAAVAAAAAATAVAAVAAPQLCRRPGQRRAPVLPAPTRHRGSHIGCPQKQGAVACAAVFGYGGCSDGGGSAVAVVLGRVLLCCAS